jgi:hypothetical protein
MGDPAERSHIVYLWTTDRTFDAIAQGELRDLGLNRELVIDAMTESTIAALSEGRRSERRPGGHRRTQRASP